MRIFYAADHEPFPGNHLWHNNLYLPLVDLGHDVLPFDFNLTPYFFHADPSLPHHREFIDTNRCKLEETLLAQIKRAHRDRPIDVFFSYFYNAFCRPDIIREIRAMGICSVNWYCNGSFQFHLVDQIAPAYDYCLVPEKFRLEDYKRVGANPIYCQEAANPNIYKSYSLPHEFDITFVGQRYGDRPNYIRYLLDAGLNVRVWGPGWRPASVLKTSGGFSHHWKRLASREGWTALWRRLHPSVSIPAEICGPPLGDDELIKMYSRSKISLGFSSCGNTHQNGNRILQVRLRDFEAPMSGAFYMVEHMDELLEFFTPGKEIVCYRNQSDLADKAKYYLQHGDERENIRREGQRRALNEHTWQKRLDDAFRKMGLQ